MDIALITLVNGNISQSNYYIQGAVYNLKKSEQTVAFLNRIGLISDDDTQKINQIIEFQLDSLNNLLNES